MPLDPQCQAIVDAANAAGAPFDADDHLAIRRLYRAGTAAYRHPAPPLDSVANLMLPGPAASIPVRIYRPRAAGRAAPALLWLHGGGWVVGDLDTHDHLCRYLAAHAAAVVIAVDYRLAPEHPFPAALDDAGAALRWVAAHAAGIGVDAARLAIGGDSAGGNLAAATAQAMRDEADVALRFQLLVYPALDFTADNASLRDNGSGYLLSRAAMERFADWYLPDRTLRSDCRASPGLAADLSGLPPALVQTAEYDPLRDEAADYAQALKRAGVAVDYRCYPGTIHGFARMGGKVDAALRALDDAARALTGALAGRPA